MSNDIERTLLRTTKLPDTVQGDGRYLMRLLKEYLEEQAVQLNIANGFTADEIQGTADGTIPRHFTLTFDRTGGHFTWDYPTDIREVAYYELRTDTNIGSTIGLLEKTFNNSSDAIPHSYAATVYLYAVTPDGMISTPARLSYTKQRPFAPSDLALTKNNEGTLITFLAIPSDCLGANIYIDGVNYTSFDNVFLYRAGEDYKIKKLEVSYFDSFGEGERAVLLCVMPDVTGFFVERNGANLDFYWNPIDVYGVMYEVRVGVSADWNLGWPLFTTKTNNKNRYIYPNEGDYYLMVKAYDDHGNYSENAAWQLMNTIADIHRNVILKYDQSELYYPGTKINMYYDYAGDNIALEREALYGEYIMDITLPQRYRARNWLSFDFYAYSTDELIWDDAEFAWDDAVGMLNGATVESTLVDVEQKIAFYVGPDTTSNFLARENEDVTPELGGTVLEEQNADVFADAHYGKGVKIKPLTELSYTITDPIPSSFNMVFSLKTTTALPDTILMVLADDSHHFLYVGHDTRRGVFYLVGSDGTEITLPKNTVNAVDWIVFGVSQGTTNRALYISSLTKSLSRKADVLAAPLGNFTKLYCYPKIIA